MTVENTNRRVEYIGDGTQSTYSYSFPIIVESDLVVAKTDADGSNPRVLTLNTDYQVDPPIGLQTGGTITLLGSEAPLGSDERLVIIRKPPLKQENALRNQGTYYATVHEESFDYATMADQYLEDRLDRCLQKGFYDVDTGAYDADGAKIKNLGDPSLATDSARLQDVETLVANMVDGGLTVAPQLWKHTGDGTTTEFSIPNCPSYSAHLYDVYLDGVAQVPDEDYSINYDDEKIVFVSAPGNGVEVVIRQRGYPKSYKVPPVYTSSTLPTADATQHGKLVLVKDANRPEELRCCMRRSNGAYEWAIIGVASP